MANKRTPSAMYLREPILTLRERVRKRGRERETERDRARETERERASERDRARERERGETDNQK